MEGALSESGGERLDGSDGERGDADGAEGASSESNGDTVAQAQATIASSAVSQYRSCPARLSPTRAPANPPTRPSPRPAPGLDGCGRRHLGER